MLRNPSRGMSVSAALFLLLTLEQILFGRDTPGTAHDVSVVAWFASLVAAAAFLVLLGVWVTRRRRARRVSTE